jgi:hypothetical protein
MAILERESKAILAKVSLASSKKGKFLFKHEKI